METNNTEENVFKRNKQRITVKLTHPNPLFEKWLTEWILEAETKDTKLKYTFQNALKSLKKYPIPLQSGKECAILKGFGTRICQMLDQRLCEYRKKRENQRDNHNQLIENESVSQPKRAKKLTNSSVEVLNSKNSSGENYVPRTGSGGYAILLTLLSKEQEPTYSGFMLKNDLLSSAQQYCDKSMTVPELGTRYTAWSSMKTLLEKDLVRSHGRPAKFSLTDNGRNIAIKLHADNTNEDETVSCSRFLNVPEFKNKFPFKQKSKSPSESFKKRTKPSEVICIDDENYPSKHSEGIFDFNSPPPYNSLSSSEKNTSPLDKIIRINNEIVSSSKETSQSSIPFEEFLETNSCEIISINNESYSPKYAEHNFNVHDHLNSLHLNKHNMLQSTEKKEITTKYLEDANYISDKYVPNSGSNEFAILKKIFLESQNCNYVGFALKSEYNTHEDICSIEILLKNRLIEENLGKISITDEGLNIAISLYSESALECPSSPKNETNEEIIEGIINSPLFKNKSRMPYLNLEDIENNDLPISSLPKSPPLNWKPKSSKIENKIETIDLDGNIVISENPIFMKIKSKFADIQTNLNNFSSDSDDNTILTVNNKGEKKEENEKWNKNISDENESPKEGTKNNFDDIVFHPFEFDIILLVDTQETTGSKKSNLNDVTQQELMRHGIQFEICRLSVGDFTWIARNKLNQELILPYILERKRMDDLSSSIKDGRFHEQKFRLKQCGIQNLIYLIESYGSKDHLGLPFNTLLQAATNTQLQENFIVKFTECHKHSIAYISTFTKQLIQIFKDKTLTGCSKETLIDSDIIDRIIPLMVFSEFNKASIKNKNVTIRELFIRQLLQIKGISFEKVMAITEKYPSPLRLRSAYMKNPHYISEKLLSSIQYGKMNRFIGPVISKTVYQLYTKKLL